MPPELRNETEMVNNLLQVVEEKMANGRFPQPFGQGAQDNSGSFRKFKKYLNHYLENDYKNYVPETVKKIDVSGYNRSIPR